MEEKPIFRDKTPEGYEFLWMPWERERAFGICRFISEYVIANEIASIVFLDRAARPAWAGVHEYMKIKYPDHKQPAMFFVDPYGFRSRDDGSNPEKELATRHRNLLRYRNQPTALFDVCMHSGDQMERVRQSFEQVGFFNLRVLVSKAPELGYDNKPFCKKEPDAFFDQRGDCHPFYEDILVQHAEQSVIGEINPSQTQRTFFRRLRGEMRKIIRDHMRVHH